MVDVHSQVQNWTPSSSDSSSLTNRFSCQPKKWRGPQTSPFITSKPSFLLGIRASIHRCFTNEELTAHWNHWIGFMAKILKLNWWGYRLYKCVNFRTNSEAGDGYGWSGFGRVWLKRGTNGPLKESLLVLNQWLFGEHGCENTHRGFVWNWYHRKPYRNGQTRPQVRAKQSMVMMRASRDFQGCVNSNSVWCVFLKGGNFWRSIL